MLKINKNVSVIISIVLAFVFIAALAVAIVMMPDILNVYLDVMTNKDHLTSHIPTILGLLYGIAAVALVAVSMLIILLFRVRRGEVFTALSVSCLRGISWCFVLLVILFLGLSFAFYIALVCAAAAALMCLLMRVVKNVIEEATAIKADNDFTI